jgi:catechol 2,3-dioxygenase-like lactoylglutathione lyase family enzyme
MKSDARAATKNLVLRSRAPDARVARIMPTSSLRPVFRVFCAAALLHAAASAQAPASLAPEGAQVQRVWHLGRVTGDLTRIVDFYHDTLGLNLRGASGPIAFNSVAAINEFVRAPAHAEFRAAFMPIPGASAAAAPQDQIYLEAFEYRNIERRQLLPPLSSPGASSLRLLVRDLPQALAAVKKAGASVMTPGGEPVPVPAPGGLSGTAHAIVVRDPDGYPVELTQVTPAPVTPAPAESAVLGAQMSVAVTNLDASLTFYRGLLGADVAISAPSAWQRHDDWTRARGLAGAEFRTAVVRLPGSAIALELVEYRGVERPAYRPVFQDIGHGHVALIVKDIQATVDRMKALGATSIAAAGTWTQINPMTRAVYTRDPDGFFIEILERR